MRWRGWGPWCSLQSGVLESLWASGQAAHPMLDFVIAMKEKATQAGTRGPMMLGNLISPGLACDWR